jgi:uncharacterized protein (TIGR02246 family)
MAKFEANQVADVLAIHQVINEWAFEMDVNNGLTMAPLLTEDCQYVVRGECRDGRDAVVVFYTGRLGEFPDGPPIHRHALANQRVTFKSADEARCDFNLTYFSSVVTKMGADVADPLSYADVWMDCRREADGHWRIASFDSKPVFVRSAKP